MRKALLSICLLAAAVLAQAATVVYDGSSVTFEETTDDGTVKATFKKCMANDLFTFYQVWLDGKLVNSAQYSDNIGPFLVTGYGWIGGNHLSDANAKTAKTVDVQILADDSVIAPGTYEAKSLTVNVKNELYMPDGSLFAIETMKYLVAGNSIEVWATHDFQITSAVTVDRYYGMQSMFVGETEILAPGAKKYNKWISFTAGGADNSIRFTSYESPKFSVFVEKSANAYQASYLVREDLGTRGKIAYDDVVFIGNSYEKSYHKTIGNAKIQPGETTHWHGVYSWFKQPLTDWNDNQIFEYPAYMGGNKVTLKVDSTGTVTTSENAGAPTLCPDSCANKDQYYTLNGVKVENPIAGRMYLRNCDNEVTKVLMK